jgi:ABC-type sugar transport system substrate-binding protein
VGCSQQPAEELPRGVVLLRYNPGSESTEQRERGFLDTLQKEYPQITVLSSDQYAGTTPEQALDKAQQILSKYGDSITGIFCVCEPNAAGMLEALEQANLLGKVKFVGFDPTPRMIQAVADGNMDGIILQDPVAMGYLGVKTMIAHLEGRPVEEEISTGESVANPENLQKQAIQALVNPPIVEGNEFVPENAKYTLAVIPKGTTHEFWKSVHFGAEKAARELGNVQIVWKGPLQENDREGQINVVQDFITQKVDGIVLAPLDAVALVDVVKEAAEENIPTVIFDSDLASDVKVSYVATDNYRGGVLAARTLAAALGQKPQQQPTNDESADDESADNGSPMDEPANDKSPDNATETDKPAKGEPSAE